VLENRPHALRIGDPGEKVGLKAWQRHGRIMMQKNRLSHGKPDGLGVISIGYHR
jgi:hypothetical protein